MSIKMLALVMALQPLSGSTDQLERGVIGNDRYGGMNLFAPLATVLHNLVVSVGVQHGRPPLSSKAGR
jgi:hypothetical protein